MQEYSYLVLVIYGTGVFKSIGHYDNKDEAIAVARDNNGILVEAKNYTFKCCTS